MHVKAVRTCTQSQRDPCTQAAHPHNGISAPNLVWSPQMRGLAPNLNVIRAPAHPHYVIHTPNLTM
jgi:hypothetical protein